MSGGGGICRARTEVRWMRFVDGENFTFQGSKFLQNEHILSTHLDIESPYYIKDQFLWIPVDGGSAMANYNLAPQWANTSVHNNQMPEAIRSYYYTMVTGAKDEVVPTVERKIWDRGFTPRVIWKEKGKMKSKAVDSSISVDMLSAAYENQFDLVEIWTGDADYIPLVNAVKKLGKVVVCCFFGENYGLSSELKIACDRYCDISGHMSLHWTRFSKEPKA